jgi:adenylate kinase
VPNRHQLVERLLKRAAEEGRPDDTLDVIERRLSEYHEKTEPLVEYYRSTRNNVVGVHADRTVDEVFHEIQDSLQSVEARA